MTQEYHKLLNNPQFYVEGIQEYSEVVHCDQNDSYVLTVLEIIWFSLIQDLVRFGISKKQLINIRNTLFAVENDTQLSYLESKIIKIFQEKSKYYLIVNQNKSYKIIEYHKYCDLMAKGMEGHICISVNEQIKKCFGEIVPEDSRIQIPTSYVERQILDIIRNHSFVDLKITTKNGRVNRVHVKEVLKVNRNLYTILKNQDKHQSIKIEQQNGSIVHLEKTKKIKIKHSDGQTTKLL